MVLTVLRIPIQQIPFPTTRRFPEWDGTAEDKKLTFPILVDVM
jgi:hypothetical protein